jgi:nucleoside-diphosphate-sugar epimerase
MVLVTGASGFVGGALCRTLRERGVHVTGAVRGGARDGEIDIGNLSETTEWGPALSGCSAVYHLAARVHVMSDNDEDPLHAYRKINVDATLNLARQSVEAGVKRFVFVSSIKVNGESTTDRPFRPSDVPNPCDPYGQSKYEAELALLQLGRETGLEVVIVRPPLVYGPGVKANFLKLMRLVKLGLPLPLASIHNLRSMVALDNLVDLLIVCGEHPGAVGGIFLVSDGNDVSITDLVRSIATSMDKKILLVPLPSALMTGVAKLLGAAAAADRLLASLQVDITDTQAKLEWNPRVSLQAAINQTVSYFLSPDLRNK